MKRTDIVHRIAETMHRIAPTARTILIVVDEKELTPETELTLRRPLSELEAQTGVAINTLVVLKRVWENITTPLTLNINREGIVL